MAYNGNSDYMYHLHIKRGDTGRYVLLPGDPFRTDAIATRLQEPQLIATNREHRTWSGYLDGEKVTVTSTGMGSPSAAISVEELILAGADTFIRVGTAGPVSSVVKAPGVQGVIATACVRDEGTTKQYIPVEYPAVASLDVCNALVSSAEALNYYFLHGIVQTKDSFYSEVEPSMIPNEKIIRQRWEAWQAGNVLCSDMESAALFVLASIRGCRAGSILSLGDIDTAIAVSCEAVRRLIRQDKKL